jgi:hypothetical protein
VVVPAAAAGESKFIQSAIQANSAGAARLMYMAIEPIPILD